MKLITQLKRTILSALVFTGFAVLPLTGCYSVFSGGTGGSIVDAESTSDPKEGIANVDIYAYTSEDDRDSDYNSWTQGTVFTPQTEYYGHTTTSSDGSFTISKLVWKSYNPSFGKDADTQTVYLLYYHENYGLTKGSTVIISDSATDTVYAELTKIRKTTTLNINLVDVADYSNTSNNIYVKVTVPQSYYGNTAAASKVFDANLTGSGTIKVSYPRYLTESDKNSGTENTPSVSIQYYQSADDITWKACYNGDSPNSDYAFRTDGFTISKTISNSSYDLSLYGKAVRNYFPSISGQYCVSSSESDDGVTLILKDSAGTVNYDTTTTHSETLGTSSTEKHGVFSGLGSGQYWDDSAYTDRVSSIQLKIEDDSGSKSETFEVTSGQSSCYVRID